MPPLAVRFTEYSVPTAPLRGPAVVMDGIAGTVSDTDADFAKSAIDVAVTVMDCAVVVAAGAVNVAEMIVVFESVPPPVTAQVTPAALRSLLTLAVRLIEFVPSTVKVDALTETLTAESPAPPLPLVPPHPMAANRHNDTPAAQSRASLLPNMKSPLSPELYWNQWRIGFESLQEILEVSRFQFDQVSIRPRPLAVMSDTEPLMRYAKRKLRNCGPRGIAGLSSASEKLVEKAPLSVSPVTVPES